VLCKKISAQNIQKKGGTIMQSKSLLLMVVLALALIMAIPARADKNPFESLQGKWIGKQIVHLGRSVKEDSRVVELTIQGGMAELSLGSVAFPQFTIPDVNGKFKPEFFMDGGRPALKFEAWGLDRQFTLINGKLHFKGYTIKGVDFKDCDLEKK
jgi:hypothetical protein